MVTVAIPVLNGRRWLGEVLGAVRAQHLDRELELLICDSGSLDGSRELALDAGARVIDLEPGTFHHASTRNLLTAEARGEFVAMLSQDATPVGRDWLASLLSGFEAAERVALVYGPYRPRADCPALEAARLERFFASLSPDGRLRIDRLTREEIELGIAEAQIGPARGYFTDANGCVRRSAWEQIPYPPAPYAEDHALALAMLQAGWAKTFVPAAAVLHSHHYTPAQQLRRAFDDNRGLAEVYGYRSPVSLEHITGQLRGAAGVGLRGARRQGLSSWAGIRRGLGLTAEQMLALTGAALGSRAERLPVGVRRRLSLERRGSFEPLDQLTENQRCT